MSDKSINPSVGERSVFASGRPDRIKSALQSNKNTGNDENRGGRRVRLNTPTKGVSPYNQNKNLNSGFEKKASTKVGSIQTTQRSQIGAGPKRKASDNLSEILARQKGANASLNEGAQHFKMANGSANDDIAHAAELLEEIKSDSNKKPIMAAFGFTVLWIILCIAVGLSLFNSGMVDVDAVTLTSFPVLFSIAAVLFIPCVLSWGVAVFLYRARELHQISLSLAYTALHLTQPEDMASDSIATIGQAVRREVAAMGDGIDRAINRATTLESKFRNEVGNIQGFYKNNENIFAKIITNLEKERERMASTGEDLESRLPKMLDGLKESSFDFSKIVESADERFSALAATADERLKNLSHNIEEKNMVLKVGLEGTIDNVARVSSALDTGTDSLNNVTDKLAKVSNVTVNKLEKISGNFKRQTADLNFATTAITKANDEINTALQNRHEKLSGSAEHLLENAEQINNLLSSYASVIDESFLGAEDRTHNLQNNLRHAAEESAAILQTEMNNIRKATSTETQKLIELLKESSFTATVSLREDIQAIVTGSKNEVQGALVELMNESRSVGEGLKAEAVAVTEMMHREMQAIKQSALGNTEQGLVQIRKNHEAAIADIIGRIEQAGEKLSSTADGLNFVTGRMDDEMEATRRNLASTVARIPEEAKQALGDMQAYIDGQAGALNDLAKTVGGLSNAAVSAPVAPRRANRDAGRRAAAPAPSRPAERPARDYGTRAASRPSDALRQNEARAPKRKPAARNTKNQAVPRDNRTEQSAGKWEMPDLLSRASSNQSLPEHLQPRADAGQRPAPLQQGQTRQSELHSVESLNALSLDLAKALDHQAPDQLWERYRNGERNVFTRRLYTLRGQKLFDEVSYKYRNEASFRRDVDRYISDFEELLTKIYEQDRDSMLIDTYLSSETGKVYLMLAHASGRLD